MLEFPDKESVDTILDLSCEKRFATKFNDVSRLFTRLERLNLDLSARAFKAQLKPLKAMPDCLRTGIVAITVVKNEIDWLRHFLDHYRALGVSGFVIIDNCSTDGTSKKRSIRPRGSLLSRCSFDGSWSHCTFSPQRARRSQAHELIIRFSISALGLLGSPCQFPLPPI